jgi:hypothetical protein
MKFPLSPLCAMSLAFASSFLHAQQDAPAVNADSILRDLDMIEQQQKQTIVSARQAAMNQLKAAAASGQAAVSLYTAAVEAVQFDGKANQSAAFSDWKSSKADLLRSHEMQAILQMHLRYLVLSLDRGASDKPELFVAPALAYANDLFNSDSLFFKPDKRNDRNPSEHERQEQALNVQVNTAKKDLLDKSVADGIFSKWFRLSQWLPKGDDWELTPGDLSGILDKDVRTPMRAQKDARLIETWDMEMKLLADRATSGRLDFVAADFNTVTRPKMMFSRANDMIIVGQKNRGISDIYLIVKTYPQHPDFSKWVARLREVLKKPEPSAETTTATTAPAATNPSTSP